MSTDYRASADSTIKIFQDRIEYFNPGTLSEGVSLEEILSGKSASNPRNKQIASIFKEAGIIEKYGSGIKRVKQAMLAAGAKEPIFELVGNFFKVTLYPINGGVKAVLAYLKQQPGAKTKDLATALGIAERTLQRLLKTLKYEQKVVFQGAPKTGGYFVRKDDE